MTDALHFVLARYNYWIVIVLMMTGLYIVFSRGNLVKTVVGLNIFQTSVFIFYITLGKVAGGTAPILIGGHGEEEHGGEHGEGHGGHEASHEDDHGATLPPDDHAATHDPTPEITSGPYQQFEIQTISPLEEASDLVGPIIYSNPLPHVLILTAIVVGVATTAVGLAIAVRIREAYGTVEEDALERMDNEASGYPEGQPAT